MLVAADAVGLYPSIPFSVGLNSLKKSLQNRADKQIPTSDLVKLTEFVFCNNCFEFSEKLFQQISGTAISTKFAPYISMDEVETEFCKPKDLNH